VPRPKSKDTPNASEGTPQLDAKLTDVEKLVAHYYLADPERDKGNAFARAQPERCEKMKRQSVVMVANTLFKSPAFANYLSQEIARLHKKVKLDEETVLREWVGIATLDPVDCYDTDGNVLPIHEIPAHARRAIASFDVETDHKGRTTTKIKLCSKTDALNALSKNLGLFKKVNEIRLGWIDEATVLEKLERRSYIEGELVKRGLLPAPIEKDVTPEPVVAAPEPEPVKAPPPLSKAAMSQYDELGIVVERHE